MELTLESLFVGVRHCPFPRLFDVIFARSDEDVGDDHLGDEVVCEADKLQCWVRKGGAKLCALCGGNKAVAAAGLVCL